MDQELKKLFGGHSKTAFYVVTGVIVILEAWFLYTFLPAQIKELGVLSKSSQDLSAEVKELDRAVAILQKVDRKQLAADLAKVNAAVPNQKKTSGLVRGISSIASASGVFLKELEFSPGKISTDSAQQVDDERVPGSNARMVLATLNVNGDLPAQSVFLAKLQSANQLLGVANFNFSGSSVKQVFSSLSLQVYYEPAVSGKIDWKKVRPLSEDEQRVLKSLNAPDTFILPEEQR